MTTPDVARYTMTSPESSYQGTVRPLGTSVATVAMRTLRAQAELTPAPTRSVPARETSPQVRVAAAQPSVQTEGCLDLYGCDLEQPSLADVRRMGGLCL